MSELSAEQLRHLSGLWRVYNPAFQRLADASEQFNDSRVAATDAARNNTPQVVEQRRRRTESDEVKLTEVNLHYQRVKQALCIGYVEICGPDARPVLDAYIAARSPHPALTGPPPSQATLDATQQALDALTGGRVN